MSLTALNELLPYIHGAHVLPAAAKKSSIVASKIGCGGQGAEYYHEPKHQTCYKMLSAEMLHAVRNCI